MSIGQNIKNHRISAGITQGEIAKATGISQQAQSTWENGIKIPTAEKCITLADFYGISVDELIGHEVKNNW